jgi:hypothetical protein
MVNVPRVFYNAVLLGAALLAAAGCGKPGGPPPGATEGVSAPTVDLGSESGPKDPAAGPSSSTPDGGSPQGDPGDKK